MRNEKGSITVLVLATMLLVTGVIFVSYFSMSNKSSSQLAQLNKIQEEYMQTSNGDNMDEAYENALGKVNIVFEPNSGTIIKSPKENAKIETQVSITPGNRNISDITAEYVLKKDNSQISRSSFDIGENGKTDLKIEVSEIGNYTITVIVKDKNGNDIKEGSSSIFEVINGDIVFDKTPSDWTNQEVTVAITYPQYEDVTYQYSEDGTSWENSSESNVSIVVNQNKKIYARIVNDSEEVIQENEYNVDNIDKDPPQVTLNPTTTRYEVLEENETVDIKYSLTAKDVGGSGLNTRRYGWSDSNDKEPETWETIQDGQQLTRENCVIGTYYLWVDVTDNAGNKSYTSLIRYTVVLQEPVARIDSTDYRTIQAAIDAAKELQASGRDDITIEILRDTDEESTIDTDTSVTIDLKGHTIGSSNSEKATITNNGTLILVDTSAEKTGRVENLVNTAIQNNGTFTLGQNDGMVDTDTPDIYGKQIGINTIDGTFNFYDGTVSGETPIYKIVVDMPDEFGPVTIEENGTLKVYLAVTSGYVARIDYIYYTTLQEAIDACESKEDNTEETEIVIIKDIVLDQPAVVQDGKNIRLNLNGYTLTSSGEDYVIRNEGKLNITDDSTEQTGKMTVSAKSAGTSSSKQKVVSPIYNTKDLTITSGTIEANNDLNFTYVRASGIHNAQTATANIAGGTINSSYGAYNEGTLNMSGGTINALDYGIYQNLSTAIINMANGTIDINVGNKSKVYGIYNLVGKLEVSGGTINVKNIGDSGTEYAYGIYNGSSGVTEITNGTISAESGYYCYGIYNSSGTIEITDVTISTRGNGKTGYNYGINNSNGTMEIMHIILNAENGNTCYGIYNYNSTIEIIDGTISCNNENMDMYKTIGIYNSSKSKCYIESGKIEVYNESRCSGIENYGILEISTGEVSSNSPETYDVYAINNASSTGTVTIGKKGDGETSINNPKIISQQSYGVNNEGGVVNFYDGIIQGKIDAIAGGISEIEEQRQIRKESGDEYTKIYLEELVSENVVINENTGKEYTKIEEAVKEAQDNEETILKILKDFDMTSSINIGENKNIILDLQGYTITSNYCLINNNGKLTITDSKGEGKINFTESGRAIKNNNELIIRNGEISNFSKMGVVETYVISNGTEGILNMTGGHLICKNDSEGNVTSGSENCCGVYNRTATEQLKLMEEK